MVTAFLVVALAGEKVPLLSTQVVVLPTYDRDLRAARYDPHTGPSLNLSAASGTDGNRAMTAAGRQTLPPTRNNAGAPWAGFIRVGGTAHPARATRAETGGGRCVGWKEMGSRKKAGPRPAPATPVNTTARADSNRASRLRLALSPRPANSQRERSWRRPDTPRPAQGASVGMVGGGGCGGGEASGGCPGGARGRRGPSWRACRRPCCLGCRSPPRPPGPSQ